MSKEIAQTVGSKRIAWLLAILAAFAVMATLGTQVRPSKADITASPTIASSPVSGNVVPGQTITYTATVPIASGAVTGSDTLTVDLPAGATYVSSTCDDGAITGLTLVQSGSDPRVCTITGTGDAAGTVTLTVTAEVPATAAAGSTIAGATASADDDTNVSNAGPTATLTVIGATGTAPADILVGGGNLTFTFNVPDGLTVCSSTLDMNGVVPVASDFTIGNGTFSAATAGTAADPRVTTVTVVPGGAGDVTVAIKTHPEGTTASVDCVDSTPALSTSVIAPELRHIADDGSVITQRDVENNVRGSRHTVCAVDPASDSGVVLPGPIAYPGAITVVNTGGYQSTLDTDPTVNDVSYPALTIGGPAATCFSWRSLDAGDQSISMTYIGVADLQPHTVDWENDGPVNLVKEWNRLEDSEVTLTQGTSSLGTAAGNSTTTPVISRTIGLTMNQASGQWRATPITIVDAFRGSHTNAAGDLEGPMILAGVDWEVELAANSSTCGTLSGTLTETTTLLSTGEVGNNVNVTFDPAGCAPGQVVRIVITGEEPGAFASGEGNTVTQIVEFTFSAQVAAKQVFLAWAGQRIILEHDWRLPGGDAYIGGSNGPSPVGSCPFLGDFEVTYVRGGGPGNFLTGLGAWSSNWAEEALVEVEDDASQSFLNDPDIPGDANGSCISRVLYESEDQGQVYIEAFVTAGAPDLGLTSDVGEDGLAYTKHAFVIYYMKINTVNVSLATQFSKPSHNHSYYYDLRDWANTSDVTKAPTNPWDASKDDSDNAADWNVSKDLLVRGRVTGWFLNSNPSGRARDDSNPLNVLPADRWVMPNDWALLAGGPADNADGSAAKGTAEQFMPYFDIMTSPNNPIYALSDPTGSGYAYAGYVTYTDDTDVSAGNTGNGSAANPIAVVDCSYLVAGAGITFGDATTTMRTVASCSSGELVLSGARDTAPIGGTDVRLNRTGVGSAAYPIPVSSCTFLTPGTVVRTAATALGVVSTCGGGELVVSAPASSASLLKSGTILIAPSGVPFEGPYSLVDIPGLAPLSGGAALSNYAPGNIRDTIIQDGDVNMWDAPMPPAMVSVAIRGTGFIKVVYKDDVYYNGTPNTDAIEDGGTQMYPNPFYIVNIPDSMWIPAGSVGGGYLWDSWGSDGPDDDLGDQEYWFWQAARVGVNSALIGDSTLSATDNAELAIIRGEHEDGTIARDLVIYSDNHGEFMVAANGDFKTDLTACQTNVLAGGKHCAPGDKVGTGTITATVDYPDFRGMHFPVLSNTATVTWLWGGYKDVTVEDGETDQYKYIVFHAMDRDGFCSTLNTGAILLHSVLTYEDDYDDFSSLGARYNGDPDENVDFMIDSGEGIIIGQSGGGAINDGKQFATGVQTFSVTENDPATSGVKEFPLSSLAASGQTDECQAWIKVSNSLLGVVNVLTIAHDDEGNIGFDRVIDLTNTMSYTLSFRWSLITWAGADAIPVSDALKGTGASGQNPGGNDISASVTAIYGWNAAAQQWLGYFPSGVNVPGANDLTSLKTGDAYWIAITGPSSVTWTIATNVN